MCLMPFSVKPELLSAEDEVRVIAREETLLSCTFDGFPPPQVCRSCFSF